jgi:hypothetical protein
MDEMDVDPSMPFASGSKQSLASAVASSHPEEPLVLLHSGVHALNEQMQEDSHTELWQTRIEAAGDDDSKWKKLLQSILIHLTGYLATTDLKDSVVTSMNKPSAITFVERLDKDMLEKWKAGVRSSIGENDWTGLIPYRTCSSNCRIIRSHSNVTTVKLDPKIMEQSMLHFLPFYCDMMLISHSSFAPSQRMVRADDSSHIPLIDFVV